MFQLISDCHLELVKDKAILLPKITPRAPGLVLAGDIGNPYKKNYSMFLETCSKGWDHVFVVAGNHEYYSHSARRLMSEIDEKIRSVCSQFPNVTFLQKDVFYLKDPGDPNKSIAVVGATLWTRMEETEQPVIRHMMNDYRTIFNTRSGTKSYNVSPADIDALHKDHASWLYDTVPEESSKILNPQREFIAIDPGVRTFMTYYDGESFGEIGQGISAKLYKLNLQLDSLQSKKDKARGYKKLKYKIASARIQNRIKNIVKDLHYKTRHFLSNYKHIILPEFRVKQMVQSDKLNARTKRCMLDLAHFKFKLKLAQLSSKNRKVILCNEAWTSKTCTRCGSINPNLGSKKIYKCPSCDLVIDRDYNGCRNVLLRVLSKC
jgi:hypothetical protein